MDAAGQVAHLADRGEQLDRRRVDQLGGARRAVRAWSRRIASATSRCWAPSWRSRSIRRRSASAASTIRAATRGPPRAEPGPAPPAARSRGRAAPRTPTASTRPGSSRSIAGSYDEDREQLAVALEAGDRRAPCRRPRQLDRLAVGPDEPVAGRGRERQLERRVAQRPGERVAQAAERHATAELDGEVRDARPGQPGPHQADEVADRKDERRPARRSATGGRPAASPHSGRDWPGEVPRDREAQLDRRGDRDRQDEPAQDRAGPLPVPPEADDDRDEQEVASPRSRPARTATPAQSFGAR